MLLVIQFFTSSISSVDSKLSPLTSSTKSDIVELICIVLLEKAMNNSLSISKTVLWG
jgi:hypothetical protein